MIDIDYLDAIDELNSQFPAGNCCIKLTSSEKLEYLQKKYSEYNISLDFQPEINSFVLSALSSNRILRIRMSIDMFNNEEYITLVLNELEKKITKEKTHDYNHYCKIYIEDSSSSIYSS